MSNVYQQGTPVIVSTDQPFTDDLTGQPVNPTTVTLWIGQIGPDGDVIADTVVTYVYGSSAMENPSTGVFSMQVPTGSLTPGVYTYYYQGTGACATAPVPPLPCFIISELPT